MKKVGNWLAISWYPVVLWGGASILCGLLFWYALGSLAPGLSQNETTQVQASSSVRALYENPLGLPHKVLQFIPQYLQLANPATIRIPSTILALMVVGGFFYVVRSWYSTRVAVLGSLLFATSSWMLHGARHGSDAIAYSLLFLVIACAVWLKQSRGSAPAVLASTMVIIGLLYLPGMIWFLIPVALWQTKHILRFLQGQSLGLLILITFGGLAILSPLALAIIQQPELARTYFGIPAQFGSPVELLRNLVDVPVQVFVRGPDTPDMWLGRLPLLDWFTTIMFVVGMYAYFYKRRLDRTPLLLYVGAVGAGLVALQGPVHITILLPFIYLVATGGIALMLQQWFTVFPKNPFARNVGSVLITAAVIMASVYNLNRYFIAWPNTPETKQVFTEQIN